MFSLPILKEAASRMLLMAAYEETGYYHQDDALRYDYSNEESRLVLVYDLAALEVQEEEDFSLEEIFSGDEVSASETAHCLYSLVARAHGYEPALSDQRMYSQIMDKLGLNDDSLRVFPLSRTTKEWERLGAALGAELRAEKKWGG